MDDVLPCSIDEPLARGSELRRQPQQLRTEDFARYAQKVEAAAGVAGKPAFNSHAA